MVTRKHTRRVWLVPLAVVALEAFVVAGAKGGGPPLERGWWAKPQPEAPALAKVKVPPNPTAMAAKARLDSSSAKKWSVEWNDQTGMIAGISGESRAYKGSPRSVAEQFVGEHRALFAGSDRGEIGYTFDTSKIGPYLDRTTVVVKMTETYGGIPVVNATLAVHVKANGQVIWAGGTLYRIDSLHVTPVLTGDAVVAMMRQALLPDSMELWKQPELVVLPGTPPHLAYKATATVLVDGSPFSSEFFFDAQTGGILGVGHLYIIEHPIYPSLFQKDTAKKADTAGHSSSPPPGHDYLGRVPVLDLAPVNTERSRDTVPPPVS